MALAYSGGGGFSCLPEKVIMIILLVLLIIVTLLGYISVSNPTPHGLVMAEIRDIVTQNCIKFS